jgi:hydrogenase expression/formation protein HypC
MCLAVPGRVVDVTRENDMLVGRVDFGGISRRVCLELLPDAVPGEYVLVHVGFALARIDEEEAQRTLRFLREMNELEELGAGPE